MNLLDKLLPSRRRKAAERTTDAIRTDRWDEQDVAEVRASIGAFAGAAEALAEVHPAAPDLLDDLYTAFVKPSPALNDAADMAPSHAVNRVVMSEIEETAAFKDLRALTTGDRVAAALAALTIQKQLPEMYRRLEEAGVEEAAEKASDALDILDRLADKHAQLPDGEEPSDAEKAELSTAEAAAEQAQAGLDEAVAAALPGLGRLVRAAVGAAAELAEEQAEAFTTWGTAPGDLARMDPATRLALAERMSTDRLRRIAELFGAFRSLTWGERQRKTNDLPEEVVDVLLGNDLMRVLPSEFINLAIPELEGLFYQRFAERHLLEYELRGVEYEGKGAVIYAEDSSGSMGGEPELAARALGLALLGIAADQGRAFKAIVFGGVGQAITFDFPEPAAMTTEAMLDYAECSIMSGGTDFMTPLSLALGDLVYEHAETGHVGADIVFATDGLCNVADEWLANFKAEQARMAFNVYGIAIGCDATAEPLAGICDRRVISVAEAITGEDVRGLFKSLTA